MSVNVLYTTKARATGGRDGQSGTIDGSFSVKLGMPKELHGTGDGVNPEQLFATGYAACFLGAMKAVAPELSITVPVDSSVTATVGIGPRTEGGFGLTIALEVDAPGLDRNEAETLVAKAHEVCPYSNATRNNIDVAISII